MKQQRSHEPSLFRRFAGGVKRLILRVREDDLASISSGLAFNMLLCLIPSLLVITALLGIFLESSYANQRIDDVITSIVPNGPYAAPIKVFIYKLFTDIVKNRRRFGIAGLATLIWTASSLFGSIRRVLNTVYRIQPHKMFLRTSIENIILVMCLGILFLLANVFAWALRAADEVVSDVAADSAINLHVAGKSLPMIISYVLALILFFIVNRYMPDRRIPAVVAWIAALTTTTLWWMAGKVFSWYVGTFHPFNQVYGTYAFLFIFLIWVYYSAMAFVLGVVVGQLCRERWSRPATNT